MATSAQPIPSTSTTTLSRKPRSLWGDAWRRLISNRAAVGGMIIIGLLIFTAIFAPLLAPHNPVVQESGNGLRQPFWVTNTTASTAPVPEHPFGTDGLGRDQLSRLIYATRVSIIVGLVPTIIVLCIGVPMGLIAGYAGGRVDNLLMRITDIVYAFPDLLFIISVSVALRETWLGQTFNGLLLIFMALSIVGWTGLARLVRGQVLSLKEKEFIEAARALGIPTGQIIRNHILPNTLAPIIVAVSFAIPGFILAEATLTFLGAGMRPSVDPANPFPTSWGVMLQEGISRLSSGPWMLLFPASCIAIVMLSFTFIGDGLRDALDPRDK